MAKAISDDLRSITQNRGNKLLSPQDRLDQRQTQFEGIFGKEGRDYENPFAGADQFREDAKARSDANEEAERRAQDIRERNVYQVASLYESLFQEGTDGIWRNFKDQGLRTLALIAAQATVASFSKGGGGFSSLLGNIGKAFSAFQGGGFGGLFGRSSGGYVPAGGMVRVNEGRSTGVELLRMGSQGGTVIPLGATAAQRSAGNVTVVQNFTLDNRGGITTPQLLKAVNSRIEQKGNEARDQAVNISRKGLPAAQQQYGQLGTI